jgi:hypothetical protein
MITTMKAKMSCSPPMLGRTDWLNIAHEPAHAGQRRARGEDAGEVAVDVVAHHLDHLAVLDPRGR